MNILLHFAVADWSPRRNIGHPFCVSRLCVHEIARNGKTYASETKEVGMRRMLTIATASAILSSAALMAAPANATALGAATNAGLPHANASVQRVGWWGGGYYRRPYFHHRFFFHHHHPFFFHHRFHRFYHYY